MTKTKIFRRFVVLCMAFCLCISSTAMSAFAMEADTTDTSLVAEENTEAITPRSNSLVFYSGGTAHVYLTKLNANTTFKKYTGIGTDGAIVNLRFTNDSTGAVYMLSFRIDNAYLSEPMGITVPAGNYTVTQAYASASYSKITINFI